MLREVLGEIEKLPEPLLEEVLHFARFLKSQASQERFESTLLSETALRKDWLRPEEDEAWCDFIKGDSAFSTICDGSGKMPLYFYFRKDLARRLFIPPLSLGGSEKLWSQPHGR